MLFDESWFVLSQCAPGTELFRSDRRFILVAHSGIPPRTLFRSLSPRSDLEAAEPQTQTDLMFDETTFLRVHRTYDGLVVRMPTAAESESIRQGMPPIQDYDSERGCPDDLQPVVLESEGKTDFLVASTFLWCRGDGTVFSPSRLAEPYEPDGPPWMRGPMSEFDAGLGTSATVADLRAALREPDMARAQRYRYVYVVMRRNAFVERQGDPESVFLTSEEAEAEAARQREAATAWGSSEETDRWWVRGVPVAL